MHHSSALTRLKIAATLLMSLAAPGCGGKAPDVEAPRTVATNRAANLFPLEKGNAWAYDVDLGEKQSTLAVTRVVKVERGLAEVEVGQKLTRYEVRHEGIWRPQYGVWLLRNPVKDGQQWETVAGGKARVHALAAPTQTPAGTFADCVRIDEELKEAHVQTTYCANVGPVRLDTQLQSADAPTKVHAELRGFSNPKK